MESVEQQQAGAGGYPMSSGYGETMYSGAASANAMSPGPQRGGGLSPYSESPYSDSGVGPRGGGDGVKKPKRKLKGAGKSGRPLAVVSDANTGKGGKGTGKRWDPQRGYYVEN